jgi:hypothetical protein
MGDPFAWGRLVVHWRSEVLGKACGILPKEPRSRWNHLAQSGTSRTVHVKFSGA